MNKVYIVTSGEYSDYHIDAVFASREKAEAYIKAKNKAEWEEYKHDEWDVQTSYNIEEYNLCDEYVDVAYWEVSAAIDTDITFAEQSVGASFWEEDGVKAHKRGGVSNSIKIDLRTKRSGECYGYRITARYCIPRNRFATEKEVDIHYTKVMRDLLAKIKYMVEVDGMTIKEVEGIINEQMGDVE